MGRWRLFRARGRCFRKSEFAKCELFLTGGTHILVTEYGPGHWN
jgi:hypothetical protein